MLLSQAGFAESAIALLREALCVKPDQPQIRNNLANVLREAGQLAEAIAEYRKAVELEPAFAEGHNNLGLALNQQEISPGAIDSYRAAIANLEAYPEAWNNLGSALLATGQFEEAARSLNRAIELRPQYPEALSNLASALTRLGQTDAAAIALTTALELRPEFPEALNNLGMILAARGKHLEAAERYRRAIELRSNYAEAYYNLAIALHATNDLASAIEANRLAIEHRPTFVDALNNLGVLLLEEGNAADAITTLEAAIQLKPDDAGAHNNLGNAQRQIGKLREAVTSYKRAIRLRAEYAEAHSNLGSALQQLGRLTESINAFQAALEINPNLAEAHNNLGNVFKDQGELDNALASYERAAALATDAAADSNRIYTLHFHPDFTAEQILAEHRAWNDRHARPLARQHRPHENDRALNRKLRIGYVSPDFRDHCQALFMSPLLANHDRSNFEIVGYSNVAAPDAMTAKLRTMTDEWRNVVGLSDHQLAEQIRRDRIDVLVDLTVHMAHNRLLAFARKPAPVQITWLGYPATTGLEAMDYRLSDPYLDPPGAGGNPGTHDGHYVEQTIRLPETFWCYDPMTTGPVVNALPALTNGFITFGCLNNYCKVTDKTLKLWAGAMTATGPTSRLIALVPKGSAREDLLVRLKRHGIEPTRVEFADRCARDRYLKLYNRIDIGLDTFPYNGHTTSLDALWMGVPVPTIIGRTAVGRAGWSQLSNLDLRELAAKSV